jgi:hypothetical protein
MKRVIEWPEVGFDVDILVIDEVDDIRVYAWKTVLQECAANPQRVHDCCCDDGCISGVHIVYSAFDH